MKLWTLTLLASEPILEAPLKLVGHVNEWLPVPSWVITNVMICPVVGLITELEVTSAVSVIRKLAAALALKDGVAEKERAV
jgi:hypothetical protein